jgi:hypothetical protein
MFFPRFVKFAVIALAFAVGSQAKATPLTYGTYYEDSEAVNCSGSTACRLNFSQFPSDNLVLINKLNCSIASTAELNQFVLEISATSGGGPVAGNRILPLGLPNPAIINSSYYYNFQQDAQYLIGQGRFPYLLASTASSTGISMVCTIVGTLVTPIQ